MERTPEKRARIAVLLGKPVRRPSVLSEVFDRLGAVAEVSVHLPKGTEPPPDSVLVSDLVAHRGLGVPELTAALCLETAGVRCCNGISATLTVWDRAAVMQALAAAGAPVPATASLATWPEVVELAERFPLVVKAADGSIGRGLGVMIAAAGRLPPTAPFAGPFMAQEYVSGDDRVHKVYVVGERRFGLIKRWPRPAGDRSGEPFAVDSHLESMSRLAGAALGLEIYGVDFLHGPNGPRIIDVNPFPSCEGIPGAAEAIAAHLIVIT